LVRAGQLDSLLANTAEIRVQVDEQVVPQATELLRGLAREIHSDGRGPGWLTVVGASVRPAEVNRVLVGAGVNVSGLEVGSDLESLFLSLTGDAS
jgi:hypothetical protein